MGPGTWTTTPCHEAHDRASETERKLCSVLGEYIQTWEKKLGLTAPRLGLDVADDAKQRHQDNESGQGLRRNGEKGETNRVEWIDQTQHGTGQKRNTILSLKTSGKPIKSAQMQTELSDKEMEEGLCELPDAAQMLGKA